MSIMLMPKSKVSNLRVRDALYLVFGKGITNVGYHWIFHDKEPKTFEEFFYIVLWYHRTSQQAPDKPEFAKPLALKLTRERNQTNNTLHDNSRKPHLICAYFQKWVQNKQACFLEKKTENI